MKIVVVYQYYQTHAAPGHSLVYDWTQHLAALGHEVTVITGHTGYMCAAEKKPKRGLFYTEWLGKVKVIRVYAYTRLHRSYASRLWAYVTFSISTFLTLLWVEKPDKVVASSPPIFPIYAAWIVCWWRKIPFIMEVRDVWPDAIIEMGAVKNRYVIALMKKMETALYRASERIIALTEGIQDNIVAKIGHSAQLQLIPCGVDTQLLYPDHEASKSIRVRYGIENKKIILYFGALGIANNVDVILRAAERMHEVDAVVWMIVGDGIQREELIAQAKKKALKNVIFGEAVPRTQARAYLNVADMGIVTLLDLPLFEGALPTKLLEYMACGKPVVCGVKGEAKRWVEAYDTGLVFEPNDVNGLLAHVQTLAAAPERAAAMGRNGVALVQALFSQQKMFENIERSVLF